jgi:hypothetical protein
LLLVAGALLLLVVLAARGESPVPSGVADLPLDRGLPGVTFSGSGAISPRGPLEAGDPALVAKIVVALAVVLLVLAVVLSVLHARRNRGRIGVGQVVDPVAGTPDTVLRLRLKEAVTEARDTLARGGGEPRDAVIRAWVTLENATERTRAPHQTATEFTVALLEEETADEQALRELRTLYQRARFGHTAADGDAERARAALDRILATLR